MDQVLFEKQQDASEQRFQTNIAKRDKRFKALKEGRWQEADDYERIVQRSILRGRQQVLAEAMRDPTTNVFERILGDSDLMPASFFFEGAAKLKTVGRIIIRSPRGSGFGTGFLVSPRLLLTNNHVIPDLATARQSVVQFNFFEKSPGSLSESLVFNFSPDELFITNESLDFTLLAIESQNAEGVNVASRGWNALIPQSGKAILNDRVNIAQHPNGRPQEISVRENRIVDIVDDFLHYTTDTEPGSSGSPVFNDQWQVAALHHAGVPKRDSAGIIVGWEANEGVRISSIMAFLNREILTRDAIQRSLFAEIQTAPPEIYSRWESTLSDHQEPQDGPFNPVIGENGNAEWTIPLQVNVSLGQAPMSTPEPQQVARVMPTVKTEHPSHTSQFVNQAEALIREFEDRPYYDVTKDGENRDQYYEGISTSVGKRKFYESLSKVVIETHVNTSTYRAGKNRFLYPWIDLYEKDNGVRELRSIYSGISFSPLELLMEDFELEYATLGEAYWGMSDQDIEERLDVLETSRPFNCEHVVPQSWFNKKEPMRGDFHHLFACESGCNSFRGNAPYFEFEEEAIRENCGRIEDRSPNHKFEPNEGKGVAARATLYFLLRYPEMIGDEDRELQRNRLAMLITWHKVFPPTRYELHRNAAIFDLQGNRNPLIDHPEWADKISFQMGIG